MGKRPGHIHDPAGHFSQASLARIIGCMRAHVEYRAKVLRLCNGKGIPWLMVHQAIDGRYCDYSDTSLEFHGGEDPHTVLHRSPQYDL